MKEEQFRPDLFEGKFGEGKKRKPLQEYMPKLPPGCKPFIQVPIEQAVIAGIVFLVLLVVAHSLGIERGKCIAAREKEMASVQANDVDVMETSDIASTLPPVAKKNDEKPVAYKEEKIVAKNAESAYTIQLVTFSKEQNASAEVRKLQKNFGNVKSEKSGAWFQVFATGYASFEEAQKDKSRFTGLYPDCFIKKAKSS
ncbi:MAG: SPOR domain-containing protein [Candidatus Omnitrophica bacterium]|nr:SPOR domain-containing protein [Candidatus Omnitrophota bacterium]